MCPSAGPEAKQQSRIFTHTTVLPVRTALGGRDPQATSYSSKHSPISIKLAFLIRSTTRGHARRPARWHQHSPPPYYKSWQRWRPPRRRPLSLPLGLPPPQPPRSPSQRGVRCFHRECWSPPPPRGARVALRGSDRDRLQAGRAEGQMPRRSTPTAMARLSGRQEWQMQQARQVLPARPARLARVAGMLRTVRARAPLAPPRRPRRASFRRLHLPLRFDLPPDLPPDLPRRCAPSLRRSWAA